MKRFLTVFRMELRQTLRSAPFITLTVMLSVLLLLAGCGAVFLSAGTGAYNDAADILPDVMPDQTDSMALYTVAAEDRTGAGLLARLETRLPQVEFQRLDLTEPVISDAINDGVDGCIILTSATEFDYYARSSLYGSDLPEIISGAMEELAREDAFAMLGVSPTDTRTIMNIDVWYVTHQSGGYNMSRYFINLIISMLLFIAITLYGQLVASRVTAEKSSRTIEVLATAVSPAELLCGKVAGVGAAALGQLLAFSGLLAAIFTFAVRSTPASAGVFSQLSILPSDAVLICVYFIFGFTLIAFIYGGLGAMVSQTEDLSGISTVPTVFILAGYLISIISSSVGKAGILLTVASFVPFWSPFVMFTRMSLETVPAWEICVSVILLLAANIFAALLSARLYRRGMLRYGKPPRLRELLRALRK